MRTEQSEADEREERRREDHRKRRDRPRSSVSDVGTSLRHDRSGPETDGPRKGLSRRASPIRLP